LRRFGLGCFIVGGRLVEKKRESILQAERCDAVSEGPLEAPGTLDCEHLADEASYLLGGLDELLRIPAPVGTPKGNQDLRPLRPDELDGPLKVLAPRPRLWLFVVSTCLGDVLPERGDVFCVVP
jgi:hypothetical protein